MVLISQVEMELLNFPEVYAPCIDSEYVQDGRSYKCHSFVPD